MEKEENRIKCALFKPSQWKKLLIVFVAANIFILWVFYYNSSNISNFYHQSKATAIKVASPPIYNVTIFHIPLLDANDMAPFYTEVKKKTWCFVYGIDPVESKGRKKCVCLENWFGLDCGIPAAVWKSTYLLEGRKANIEIRRRERPRRIILSLVHGGYQDTLDINIYNSFSVVDLFLTVEGSNQNPSMLNLLKNGYLADWQGKIIPFQLKRNLTSRLEPEQTLVSLKELWDIALKKLADFRPDDLLIFSHASSIISKDVLLFLKLYDGFPEPFLFELRPLLLKFWRQIKSNSTSAKLVPFQPKGCTFQYLASLCDFEVVNLFTNNCYALDIRSFVKNNWPVKEWLIGDSHAPSGWQCNLCCVNKCADEYQSDLKKLDLPLSIHKGNESIEKQILEKLNMFDQKDIVFESVSESDVYYAPNVVTSNKKYSYLIDTSERF